MLFPEKIVDYEYSSVTNGKISEMRLSDIKTKYLVIIFYPLDFTFVCPTELIKISTMAEDFKKLDASVVFASGDSVYSHLKWSSIAVNQGGIGPMKWPMISDINHKLSKQFNLFNKKAGTVMRSTVIIETNDFAVKHISANIDPIGRSVPEILRLLKALIFHNKNGDVCPVDFALNSSQV
jgi:alkyl hydroperoxide reductase subunit AhpC